MHIRTRLLKVKEEQERSLPSKMRTESLDELRYIAGLIAGIELAIRLVDQQQQEKTDGQ